MKKLLQSIVLTLLTLVLVVLVVEAEHLTTAKAAMAVRMVERE